MADTQTATRMEEGLTPAEGQVEAARVSGFHAAIGCVRTVLAEMRRSPTAGPEWREALRDAEQRIASLTPPAAALRARKETPNG